MCAIVSLLVALAFEPLFKVADGRLGVGLAAAHLHERIGAWGPCCELPQGVGEPGMGRHDHVARQVRDLVMVALNDLEMSGVPYSAD